MKANSDELITFVTVVECGSFSRAAEQLEQANSVVSRTVKKLENKLGVTLLNRTTRQISLTQEGEHYFRRVQNILREMATAENEILDNQLNPKGLLRIDAATPVVLHIIAPLMAEFRQRYPLVTLSLVSSETFINLIERKVDIAIRVGTLQDSTLRARKLMTSYRHILASPAYLKQYGTPQTAACALKVMVLPACQILWSSRICNVGIWYRYYKNTLCLSQCRSMLCITVTRLSVIGYAVLLTLSMNV